MVDENSVGQQAQAADEQVVLRQRSRALLEQLVQTYPQAFFSPAERKIRPLKRNIHKELSPVIQAWGFEVRVLKYALGGYTRQLRYQQALLHEASRVDLQGQPVEDITEPHKKLARDKIQQIQAKRRARNESPRKKPKKPPAQITEQSVADLQQKLSRKASL